MSSSKVKKPKKQPRQTRKTAGITVVETDPAAATASVLMTKEGRTLAAQSTVSRIRNHIRELDVLLSTLQSLLKE